MTSAMWYAILLLLQIVRAGFGDIDIYQDSRLYVSAELNGSVRSGILLSDNGTLGEYESSERYRQVYTVFPSGEAVGENSTTGKAAVEKPVAHGGTQAFLIDFTPVLAGINTLKEGEEQTIPDPGIDGLSGEWLLRREANRISLSNASISMVVVIHF